MLGKNTLDVFFFRGRMNGRRALILRKKPRTQLLIVAAEVVSYEGIVELQCIMYNNASAEEMVSFFTDILKFYRYEGDYFLMPSFLLRDCPQLQALGFESEGHVGYVAAPLR